MSRSSQKKRQGRESVLERRPASIYKGLNMGHEYGACLEGPKGKLERKDGEDEHERKIL